MFATKAIELNPTLANAYALRGQYFEYTGQIDKAIQNQQTAISLNPNLIESYVNLGRIWFDIKHDPARGMMYYKHAISQNKNAILLPQIMYKIAVIYQHVEEYEKAEEILNQHAQLSPGFFPTYAPVIWVNIEQGKFDRAESLLDTFCGHDTTGTCSFFYGMLYTFTKKYNLALPLFEMPDEGTAVPVTPMITPPDNHLLGYIYLKSGKPKEGRKILENALVFETKRGNTWNQAEIYAELGEYQKAMDKLLELEQINPYHHQFKFVQHYHIFEPLYETPEFQSLINRVDKQKEKARKQIIQNDRKSELDFVLSSI